MENKTKCFRRNCTNPGCNVPVENYCFEIKDISKKQDLENIDNEYTYPLQKSEYPFNPLETSDSGPNLFNDKFPMKNDMNIPNKCDLGNCDCNHNGSNIPRNIIIGLTGILVLLMIGYIIFFNKKSASSHRKFLDSSEKGLDNNNIDAPVVEKRPH